MHINCTGVLSGTLPLRSGLNLDAADGPHYMWLAATLHPCKVLKNVISCKARRDLQTAWIQAAYKMHKVSGVAWHSEGSQEDVVLVWALVLALMGTCNSNLSQKFNVSGSQGFQAQCPKLEVKFQTSTPHLVFPQYPMWFACVRYWS